MNDISTLLSYFDQFLEHRLQVVLKTMAIQKLPNEIMVDIFSYLDMRSRRAPRLTCKRWDELMKCVLMPPIRLWVGVSNFFVFPEPACKVWRTDYESSETFVLNEVETTVFLTTNSGGRALSLETETYDLRRYLDIVATHWTQLECLQIHIGGQIADVRYIANHILSQRITRIWITHGDLTSRVLGLFFERCINLETLGIYRIGETAENSIQVAPPRFRSLYIGMWTRYILRCFANQEQWLPNLREFGYLTSMMSVQDIVFRTMTNPLSFKFGWGLLNDQQVRALAQFENLRNLALYFNENHVTAVVELLPKLSQLRSLKIGRRFFTLAMFRSVITSCPLLQGLVLFALDHAVHRPLIQAALNELATLVHLKTLTLCDFLPNAGALVRLISNSPSLRNVDLQREIDPGNAVLAAINAKALQNRDNKYCLRSGTRYALDVELSGNLYICTL